MPDPSVLLGRLAEDFAARVRAGELPSIEEYAARHPELAERIRDLFPTLLLLESPARGGDPAATEPDDPPAPGAIAAGQSFGQYRLVREIGRGGMGVVFEAVHRALDRRVALKVLPCLHGGDDQVERFLREARTAAALHHTNIVPVFDVGQCNGVPYFAMQLIEGRGLDRAIREWQSSPPADPFRRAAYLGVQAAEALEHAHERGVIHRDVKPSNLLLDGQGVLWVADFGLARRSADSSLTQSGAVVGTPRYMSPEQAEGARRPVDHRTDVYSLGATLYELLTGRPPFVGETAADVLVQVIERDPPPPRQVNPAVPRDLETVTLRAMAKRPEDRYPTAEDLTDDLRRCLAGEPIQARRIGPLGRAWRWSRRNPVTAALIAGVFVSLTAGAAIASYFSWKADQRATDAANNADFAGRKEREANTAKENAVAALDEKGDLLYGALSTLARTAFDHDDNKQLDELLAQMKPAEGEHDRRGWEWHYLNRTIHGERRTASFARPTSSRYDVARVSPDVLRVQKVAWSDDLRRVAVLDTILGRPDIAGTPPKKAPETGQVSIWDGDTGKPLLKQELSLKPVTNFAVVDGLAMSRDGRRLAWVVRGRLTIWDVGRDRALPAPEPGGQALDVALDAGGKHFAVLAQHTDPNPPAPPAVGFPPIRLLPLPQIGGHFLLLGDSETGKVEPIGNEKKDSLLTLQGFLGDGRYLLYVAAPFLRPLGAPQPATFVLWDVAGRRERLRFSGNPVGKTVVLSPDGKSLAVAGPEDGFRVYDLRDAKVRFEVADKAPAGAPEPADAFVFSPDGKLLVSHVPRPGLRFWAVGTGQEVGRLPDCPADASAFRFSPDGLSLAVGDARGRVTLYSLMGTAPPRTLRGHGGAVSHLAYREGSLLSWGDDGALKEWELARPPAARFLANEGNALPRRPPGMGRGTLASAAADFQADGRSLLVSARTAEPVAPQVTPGLPRPGYAWRRFDPASGKELPAPPAFSQTEIGLTMSQSRGGDRVAAFDFRFAPHTILGIPPFKMPMWPSAASSLGALCTTAWYWGYGGGDWELAVWDAAANKVCFQVAGHDGRAFDHVMLSRTTLSPDGRYVAAHADTLHVWEIVGRKEIPLPGRTPGLEPVLAAFSPDGQRVAVLSREPHPTYPPEIRRAPGGPPEKAAELAVLDLGKGQAVWRHPIEVKWDDATSQLAFTPEGRALIATHRRQKATGVGVDLRVQVWATDRGSDADPLLDTLLSGVGPWVPRERAEMAFSPAGSLAALRTGEDLALWDLMTGLVRHTLNGVGRQLRQMTFGPDGTRLFLAAEREAVGDRPLVTEIHVFDTKSGQLLLTLPLAGDFAGAVAGLHLDGGRLTVSRVTENGSVEFQSFDGSPAAH